MIEKAIKVTFINDDGEPVEIGIPYSLDEITLSEYYDFLIAQAQMFKEIDEAREQGDILTLDRQAALLLDACLNIVPEAHLFRFDENFRLDQAEQCLIQENMDVTLNVLFVHILTIIQIYEPSNNNLRFEHNGEVYKVDPQDLYTVYTGDHRTAGEFIWVKEFQRQLEAENKKRNPYDDGNMSFRFNLYTVSLLARKEGEELPYKESELREFLFKRSKELKDIRASVALDIAFFLRDMIESLLKHPSSNTFTRPNQSHLKVVHKTESKK
jgi:hypothetical protein